MHRSHRLTLLQFLAPTLSALCLLISGFSSNAPAQAPFNSPDGLDLARMKNYTAARVSSGNRFVASNDDSKRIMPGETFVMANLNGPGMVTHIWITVADNEYAWPRLVRIRVYYDGHKTPSVDAPLGDFFGVGHGSERNLESSMIRDSSMGRARNSYWPMPYRKSCRVTVTNEGKRMVAMFYYHVDYRNYASLPEDVGYFHAYYRQERPAETGRNYAFAEIKGSGHYVGTVMSVIQTQASWFGEGDDLFFVDGARKPQIVGTGSEDYFNDAWGLRDSSGPWTGTPITEGEKVGSRLSAYRWHIPDPIPFHKSLWAGIEHSGWTANPDGSVRSGFEERPDFFSSVAFWYQSGVNEDLPESPYGNDRLPYGNALQLSIENAIDSVAVQHGKASVLKEVDWGKDLLYFEAEGANAQIDLPIEIKEEGDYELVGLLAQAQNYGDYIALMDGETMNEDKRKPATSEIPPPGPPILFGYLPELYVARDWALGMVHLSTGRHTLSFRCVGKDSHSVGYNLGINDIVLERFDHPRPDNQSAPVNASTQSRAAAAGPIYRGHPLGYYVDRLNTAHGDGRLASIRAIGEFGADGATALAPLNLLLDESNTDVRFAAVEALAKIGAENPRGLPGLTRELADTDPGIRCLAALAIKSMGPSAAPAVPALVARLNDSELYVRIASGEALGAIGPKAAGAVPALSAILENPTAGRLLFRTAMIALGQMGPAANAALPTLQKIAAARPDTTAAQTILLIQGKEVPTYY